MEKRSREQRSEAGAGAALVGALCSSCWAFVVGLSDLRNTREKTLSKHTVLRKYNFSHTT